MCSLNEALTKGLEAEDMVPVASPAHVHAQAERKASRAQAEEATADQKKAVDQFDKENQADKKVPKNAAFKKLHLDESLLENAEERPEPVRYLWRWMEVGLADAIEDVYKTDTDYIDLAYSVKPELIERAVRQYDDLASLMEEIITCGMKIENAMAAQQRRRQPQNVEEDVDPDFFEDDEEVIEEAAVEAPEKPKKGFGFGEREKKERRDYSSEDLWLAVYDELSATTDNEGDGNQVNKQIKAKRGERYEKVFPHGDTDIIIYAPSIEKFAFAKRVADHYGVTYDEPKEDKNKSTNGFYRYSMVIHIPEDGLYSED